MHQGCSTGGLQEVRLWLPGSCLDAAPPINLAAITAGVSRLLLPALAFATCPTPGGWEIVAQHGRGS